MVENVKRKSISKYVDKWQSLGFTSGLHFPALSWIMSSTILCENQALMNLRKSSR